jgi:hypothetical protein
MAYTDLATVKTYMSSQGGTSTANDALITSCITRAQKYIDSHCHRVFEAVTETRYYGMRYDRRIGQKLYLDRELLTVTTLTNGNAAVIASTSYWLNPRNEPPYSWIELKSNEYWNFNTDGEISVAGTWGYSATAPEDVIQACIRLTAYLYKLRDASVFGSVFDPQKGTYDRLKMPVDVAAFLEPYVRTGW